MSDEIVTIIRQCKCGHDVSTHYKDAKGFGDCLGRGCDCGGFHERNEPGPYPKQKRTTTPAEVQSAMSKYFDDLFKQIYSFPRARP